MRCYTHVYFLQTSNGIAIQVFHLFKWSAPSTQSSNGPHHQYCGSEVVFYWWCQVGQETGSNDKYLIKFKYFILCIDTLVVFPRVLTALMICVSSLVSPRLRDALIIRADHLLETMDPSNYNNPRRVVQFLRNVKHSYRPLLEKCNRIILRNIPRLDAENIGIILGLYQSLQFNNCDFRLAVKQRLTELIDSSIDPFSFTKLFVALVPMASQELKDGCVSLSMEWFASGNLTPFTVVLELYMSLM